MSQVHTYHYKYCENGHMLYSMGRAITKKRCLRCGRPYLEKCPSCGSPLNSTFHSQNYFGRTRPVNMPNRPDHCYECGAAFPWKGRDGNGSVLGTKDPVELVCELCRRFPLVVRQLRSRHQNRTTLEVADEYDVQDLLHALLKLFFEDVRAEEATPSYAGKSARMDFLLKKESIGVEVKKTRDTLRDGDIGSQLIEDIARYKTHPNCGSLVCFVYDPEQLLGNPTGLEDDLSHNEDGLFVKVVIAP